MSIQQLLMTAGGGGGSVQLVDRNYWQSSIANAAYAGIMLSYTANQWRLRGTSLTWVDEGYSWLLSGSPGDFDASLTITGASMLGGLGDAFNLAGSGVSGTWYNLASTRYWGYHITALGGEKGSVGTLAIRPAGGGSNLATASIDLYAYSEP